MKFSTTLVKQSISGHSWLGLAVGALMYIVCLSGTLAVFYQEFERWEQASIPESLDYDIQTLEGTFNQLLSQESTRTEHMYLYLPTVEIPRTSVASETQQWFVNPDGSLGNTVDHGWTELLTNLHLYLTIPHVLGLILVSALGAMLCGLIVSGFLAHPRLIKDAFKLRLDGSSRLEQVDIHNRLSVWGTPFYLLTAITGAYFGLALPMLGAYSALTDQNQTEIVSAVFGEEPTVYNEGPFQIANAFESLSSIAPTAQPFMLVVHNAGEPGQFLEILASHPQRMIYSENYQFDTTGTYLGKTGFSDGEVGKQIVYSMYYLHFGHFAGLPGKLIYSLLGLGLTVVSVTGINIWLKKRTVTDPLNSLWVAIVWGLPLMLAISAITQLSFGITSIPLFWSGVAGILAYCLYVKDETICKIHLVSALACSMSIILVVHTLKFGIESFTGASLLINLGILSVLLTLLYHLFTKTQKADTVYLEQLES